MALWAALVVCMASITVVALDLVRMARARRLERISYQSPKLDLLPANQPMVVDLNPERFSALSAGTMLCPICHMQEVACGCIEITEPVVMLPLPGSKS